MGDADVGVFFAHLFSGVLWSRLGSRAVVELCLVCGVMCLTPLWFDFSGFYQGRFRRL